MGVVTGLTAQRMLEIEAETIIDGYVDANLRLILKRHDGTLLDVGDISAVAKLGVVDTTTLDLTLTGNGSVATPFSLKGDVRNLPASVITNGALDPLRVPNLYASAILDPTYVGPGPARVTFISGGGLSTQAYQWIGKYEPWGNRIVTMVRQGSSWAILAHSEEEGLGGKIRLETQNGFQPYNRRTGVADSRWANARAQLLPTGIVMLSGLIMAGTLTAGTVIATLPAGYRPDTDMIFPVNNGDAPRTILVLANGNIVVHSNTWLNSYIALDGIAFPVAGTPWTEVGAAGSGTAFANGWGPYTSGNYGAPRFWKDPYGFVWWAGLITGGTTSTDNLPMITFPASMAPDEQTHSKVGANSNFGFISAVRTPTPGIAWKNGTSGGNSWLSLCGLAIATAEAVNNPVNNWIVPTLTGGWTRYSTTFPEPAIMRRGDGLCVAKGLLKGGSATPIKVSGTPSTVWPENELILYGVSAALFHRVDIRSKDYTTDDDKGGYIAQTGATSWVSWDNQMWMSG